MTDKKNKKPLPRFESDEAAADFIDTADLSQYDLSGGYKVEYEFHAKTSQVNLRIPEAQLQAVKEVAAMRGIPYTRLMRQWIDQGMKRS